MRRGVDVLSAAELEDLARLGKRITLSLSCDANGSGVPCVTDRLEAVSDMKRYLELHGYVVRNVLAIRRSKRPCAR